MKGIVARNSGDDEIVNPRRDEIIALEMSEPDNDIVAFARSALQNLLLDESFPEQGVTSPAEVSRDSYIQGCEQQPDKINEDSEASQADNDKIPKNDDGEFVTEELEEPNENIQNDIKAFARSALSHLQRNETVTEQSVTPPADLPLVYYIEWREQQPDVMNEDSESLQTDNDGSDIPNNEDEDSQSQEFQEMNEVMDEYVLLQYLEKLDNDLNRFFGCFTAFL